MASTFYGKTYATDDDVEKAEANTVNYEQAKNISAVSYTGTLWENR